MGLVLDSSVIIAAERRGENVTQMLKQFRATTGDQHSVISAVGLTELIQGIYRAPTGQIRTRREALSANYSMTWKSICLPKRYRCWLAKSTESSEARGFVILFVDLLIGATALEVGYSLLTGNARRFKLIPGFTVTQL
jgi:predicted nucleic acid-binding protein